MIPFYYNSDSSSVFCSAKVKSYGSGSATLVIKSRFLFGGKQFTCQRPEAAESLKMCEGDSNLRFMVGILVDVRAGRVQFFSVRLVGVRLDGQRLLHAKKAVLRIRIRRIHIFLALPDPDPLIRGTDLGPSFIKQK